MKLYEDPETGDYYLQTPKSKTGWVLFPNTNDYKIGDETEIELKEPDPSWKLEKDVEWVDIPDKWYHCDLCDNEGYYAISGNSPYTEYAFCSCRYGKEAESEYEGVMEDRAIAAYENKYN